MFGSRSPQGKSVTCIACGESVPRSEAREYDKHGDRWDRRDKEFEHLCKACFAELCQQPRDGLETTLDAAGAGEADRATFLERFRELSETEAREE
ncbi:DUF7562 family protein [Haloarcula brevis]|uniref:DUF7562 family protein n=1 Tax=Haloarcula brevis TaxID=3111453 RepID=UPI00300F1017